MSTKIEKTLEFDFIKIRAIIDTPEALQLLISKYPEIEVDILSFKENPGCECGRRVHKFMDEKYSIEEDKIFIDVLMNSENVKKKYDGIVKVYEQHEKNKAKNGESPNAQIPSNMTDYRGRVLKIGKTEEDWSKLWTQIIDERAAYRAFSVVEQEDHLKVYFL